MSEYQVIARKWRPQRFSDVVGQEHIVKTLKNAICQNRTAHAYLFVGPRGIGKTSTARIFAKALNCEAPENGEPCCKCQSCLAIADESSIDIREIDAASQNSVDSIRDLRDEVMHVPVNSRYKIYIIDEVHMLSKQAWNALLKTVEEPPPHVKFIFATTEVHMVLGTIISRCQRFDLQRISSRLICDRLRQITCAENVKISDAAIEAVARAADGGMRDAQSLLDQMIAFFAGDNNEISEDKVLSLFGLSAAEEIEALVNAIFANDGGAVIAAIHQLSAQGKNLETLFNDLLGWLRGIQICQLIANPENILEDGREMIERYQRLGRSMRPAVVQRLLETLSPVGRILHDALNKQVFLETIVLKAMRMAHAVQVEDLISRLNQLRNKGDLEVLDKLPSLAQQPIVQTIVAPVQPVVESHSEPADPPAPEQDTVTEFQPEQLQDKPEEIVAPEPAQDVIEEVVESEPVAEVAPETVAAVAQRMEKALVVDEFTNDDPIQEPAAYSEDSYSEEYYSEDVVEEEEYTTAYNIDEIPPEEPVIDYMPEPEIVEVEPDARTTDILAPEPEPPADSADDLMAGSQPEELVLQEADDTQLTADEFSAENVWHSMIKAFEKHESANPLLKGYMLEATPETFVDSMLVVCFDDEYEREHYDALCNALPLMNRLIQEAVNDWTASVLIEKRSGIKTKADNASHEESVPENSEDAATEIAETNEVYADEQPKENIDEKKSLYGVPEVQEKIEKNEFVKYTKDLFSGHIVDIHG